MKEELAAYLAEYDGGYNHRNAIRYLDKRLPTLWQRILEATAFLPEDAKPKQRCWHILNDVWEQPRCPVTYKQVKWFENRYLTYIDASAKTKDPEFWKRMRNTMKEKHGVEHALRSPKLLVKARTTTLKNHGVSNPARSSKLMMKMKETRLSTGSYRAAEDIPRMEYYYSQVAACTEESWKEHREKINPRNLPRGRNAFHLDHIFSRIDGYKQNIPAEIIGHWSNLQMLDHKENARKNRRSDIDLDTLLERCNSTSKRG